MNSATPDRELLSRLNQFSEVAHSGFSVREGLTGAGVTLLKGQDYFGNWSSVSGRLVWMSANLSEQSFIAQSVDEAVRQTLLLILIDLEMRQASNALRALAG